MPSIHVSELLPFEPSDAEVVKDALADAMASISVGETRAFIISQLTADGECRATVLGHPIILARMIEEMVGRIDHDFSQDAEGGIN